MAVESNLAHDETPDPGKRDFLYVATAAVGVVGFAAVAWPVINELNPDASVLALASAEFELGKIEEGSTVTVKWRGLPVFIRHRTAKDIQEAQQTPLTALKDPEPDSARVLKGHEQWLVMIANCTHLGCIPNAGGEFDGWLCPCHGSQYDTAGRIRKGPAPRNLVLPPYKFLSDTKIQIG